MIRLPIHGPSFGFGILGESDLCCWLPFQNDGQHVMFPYFPVFASNLHDLLFVSVCSFFSPGNDEFSKSKTLTFSNLEVKRS